MTMKALLLFTLLLLLLGGTLIAGQTPTEALAAQRQQAQQAYYQAQQTASSRRVSTRRLSPPCFEVDSYYPWRTCQVTEDPTVCGRGFNAWGTYEECCARSPNGAFGVKGCTDVSKDVECWIAGNFWPIASCIPTNNMTRCAENWGQWSTLQACCAPGYAHQEGCNTYGNGCYVASAWDPQRACAETTDQDVCLRGWGAFDSEIACCQPGAGHAEGCTLLDGKKYTPPYSQTAKPVSPVMPVEERPSDLPDFDAVPSVQASSLPSP